MNSFLNNDPNVFSVMPKSVNEFIIKDILGSGGHGSVSLVQHIKNGRIYALKSIKQINFKNNEQNPKKRELIQKEINEREKDYLREKMILYELTRRNYPHVIKLYADFQDNENRYLVMEYSQGIKLSELKGPAQNNGYIDQNLIISIATQSLEILKYLHGTCHIIHRDFKPDNIILEAGNKIKLLDFGLAAYLVNPDHNLVSNRSIKGPLRYAAPEILFPSRPPQYDYKVDIFSLGFTLYYLMNSPSKGQCILPEDTTNDNGIERKSVVIENHFYDTWLTEFVFTLFEKDIQKRPTAEIALNLLKGFQNNPKVTEIYNSLKRRNSNVNNLQFIRPNNNNQNMFQNINNNIYNNIPSINTMSNSAMQLNMANNNNVNKNIIKTNSQILQQNINLNQEQFLQPNMGTDFKILSSMKSILRLFYRLDIMEFINAQLHSIFTNNNLNLNELFVYKFYQIIEASKNFEKGQINNQFYEQMLSSFIQRLYISNTSGITGVRPMIILYMISSIFKDEFQQYFNNIYKNEIFDSIIQANYLPLSCVLPLNFNNIYLSVSQTILDFKNKYKGPFVDNFCFIILNLSVCPNCNNFFGISNTHIGQFLQLNTPNPQNDINYMINEYFTPKRFSGNYKCNCGTIGQKNSKIVCLNLPNYLFLEFEDKNKVFFSDIIYVPLYNGQKYCYKYYASIYKQTINSIDSFVTIVKMGNSFVFCNDFGVQQCNPNEVNRDNPSLALYKKISP